MHTTELCRPTADRLNTCVDCYRVLDCGGLSSFFCFWGISSSSCPWLRSCTYLAAWCRWYSSVKWKRSHKPCFPFLRVVFLG